jgi:RimJ/RimL family protein N-acetyltransferase
MAPSFTVRELLPDDAPAYVALRREMLLDSPQAFGASPDNDQASDEVFIRAHLAARRDRKPNALVATVGAFDASGVLISVCTLVREEAAKRRHIVTIVGVYTTPAHRGRGVCGMVMREALIACADWHGVDVVQLTVNQVSAGARRVYERAGFVAWGTEPDAVRVDGRSFAEVHMSRPVIRKRG